jgi:hypothetical protein
MRRGWAAGDLDEHGPARAAAERLWSIMMVGTEELGWL